MSFIGESGADGGGLTREFFTIFGKDILNYFEYTGTFQHNAVALQVRHVVKELILNRAYFECVVL